MEIGGISISDALKVGGEVGGMAKALADGFKAIKEAAVSGKVKSKAEIDAAILDSEQKLAQLRERIANLNELVAAAHERESRLLKEADHMAVENRQLQETVSSFDAFDQAAGAFVEVALANHSVAFRQNTPLAGKISTAYFCPNCFGNRKRTVLSFKEHLLRADKLECHECHTAAFVARDDGPLIKTAPVRRGNFSPHDY